MLRVCLISLKIIAFLQEYAIYVTDKHNANIFSANHEYENKS